MLIAKAETDDECRGLQAWPIALFTLNPNRYPPIIPIHARNPLTVHNHQPAIIQTHNCPPCSQQMVQRLTCAKVQRIYSCDNQRGCHPLHHTTGTHSKPAQPGMKPYRSSSLSSLSSPRLHTSTTDSNSSTSTQPSLSSSSSSLLQSLLLYLT